MYRPVDGLRPLDGQRLVLIQQGTHGQGRPQVAEGRWTGG